jgi:hypothetical protein
MLYNIYNLAELINEDDINKYKDINVFDILIIKTLTSLKKYVDNVEFVKLIDSIKHYLKQTDKN